MLLAAVLCGLCLACGAGATSSYPPSPPSTTPETDMETLAPFNCSNGSTAQHSLDLDQVLGTWHAVEIIQHRENKAQVIGRTKVSSCPTLVLSRPEAHIIRLLWTEKAVIVQYNFFVVDLNRPGYWVSSGAQNGSIVHMQYTQFAGSVEVTKAVGNHMVLTFCSPGSELYSVVMARKKQLPHEEITGVHKMLAARGFLTYSVKEACRDSASAVFAGSLLLVTFVTLLL